MEIKRVNFILVKLLGTPFKLLPVPFSTAPDAHFINVSSVMLAGKTFENPKLLTLKFEESIKPKGTKGIA